MEYEQHSGWVAAEAERAFVKELRARRRLSLLRRVMRRCLECTRLATFDVTAMRRLGRAHGLRDIPLDAVHGSLEPHRASQFDSEFRPSPSARRRWVSVWLAENFGVALPPISVVQVGNAYAVRDGHHRVSVARARGALTIAANVA